MELQRLLLQSRHSFIEKVWRFLQLICLPLQLGDSVAVQIQRTVAPNSALGLPSQPLTRAHLGLFLAPALGLLVVLPVGYLCVRRIGVTLVVVSLRVIRDGGILDDYLKLVFRCSDHTICSSKQTLHVWLHDHTKVRLDLYLSHWGISKRR